MPDPQDIVEIPGLTNPAAPLPASQKRGATDHNWLGVFFRCCHVYGRMYRTPDNSRYTGRCPKCLSEVSAKIGPGGTSQRIFLAE